jgi:competence protein ComEC
VIAIAEMTSRWSSADYLVIKAGGNFLPLAVLGLAVYTIHRRLLSALAVMPMLLALALWWYSPMPDVWISEGGTRIASRDANGAWQLTGGRRMTLDFNALLRADGDTRALGDSASVTGVSGCDKEACLVPSLYTVRGDKTTWSMAIVKKPDAFAEECLRRDIIVSRLPIPQSCIGPALILGEAELAEAGARFLSFKADDSGDTVSCKEATGGGPCGLKYGQSADVLDNGDRQRWTLKETTALPQGKRPWMPQS